MVLLCLKLLIILYSSEGTQRTMKVIRARAKEKKDEFDDLPMSLEEIEKFSQDVIEET